MSDLLAPDPPAASLELAVAAWLHAKSGRSGSAKTATAYSTTLASFRAACHLAGLDLAGDVRALALIAQSWAAAGDPAPATYNQRLAVVSSFYSFAAKRGLLEIANPIAQVDRRAVQSYAGAQALDYSDVSARLKAIDRHYPRRAAGLCPAGGRPANRAAAQ